MTSNSSVGAGNNPNRKRARDGGDNVDAGDETPSKEKTTTTRTEMDIVWQTPATPPELNDYIFRDGETMNSPLALKVPNLTSDLIGCSLQADDT